MSQQHFQKFAAKKRNSVVKEELRQEKKKYKKERAAYFDKLRDEKKAVLQQAAPPVPDRKEKGLAPKKSYEEKKGYGRPASGNIRPATQPLATPTPKAKTGERKTKPSNTTVEKSPVAAGKPATGTAKTGTVTEMPLNKFLAHCGVASRREAVELIKDGKVKINNLVIVNPAHKITATDEVKFNGKKLFVTKNLVYILLNKPKDYITTTDDPQGRKTVLQLTKSATTERIYPVGRLDRNTSGVLLLTNDGELTQKLSHPSYEIRKIYEVKLDRPFTKADFEKVLKGLVLEDGPIRVDALAYADSKDKSIIGIELHSGRNRIVRRIFESLKYDVKGLDRVMYANLTKKNVERGKWRYLSEKEIRLLKYMNKSKKQVAKQ
jgi:23S rRNA pseudouridine2605 synthase